MASKFLSRSDGDDYDEKGLELALLDCAPDSRTPAMTQLVNVFSAVRWSL